MEGDIKTSPFINYDRIKCYLCFVLLKRFTEHVILINIYSRMAKRTTKMNN